MRLHYHLTRNRNSPAAFLGDPSTGADARRAMETFSETMGEGWSARIVKEADDHADVELTMPERADPVATAQAWGEALMRFGVHAEFLGRDDLPKPAEH